MAIMEVVQEYIHSSELDSDSFTSATPLGDAGLDSLDLLKLAGLLSEALDTALPSTVLFDYPTVDALCTYVVVAQGIASAMQNTSGSQGPGGARRRSSALPPMGPQRRGRTGSFSKLPTAPRVQRNARTGSFSRAGRVSSPEPVGSLAAAGRRRPTLFLHGELSATLPLGRRATGTLLDSTRPLSELQVVVVEASAMRLPGSATSVSQGMACLEADAVGPVPAARWDLDWLDRRAPGRLPARFGAFLDGVADFDPAVFGISLAEAVLVDPQQRLLLECTLEAVAAGASLAAAGAKDHPRGTTAAPTTGVFVGASYEEYLHIGAAAEGISGYTASGGSLSVLAGRVAYLFGFTGPATLTDTACSSSLVALNGALSALRLGQCNSAVSGAVNLMLAPETTAMYHSAGMLASDGRCKTLDAAAAGYVRAEAVAATTLRIIASIGGVLRGKETEGSAVALLAAVVNQDGRSSSLTAPNGPAQQALIKSALQAAHAAPSHVAYLHMHGTGTALGDPIEVNAALTVLVNKRAPQAAPLGLAASKATFGHAEPAAGAVGLAAAMLCLNSQAMPQQLHLRGVNPYVVQCVGGFVRAGGKAAIATHRERAPTPTNQQPPRTLSGVSGFAFQGTHAHTILEAVEGADGGASVFATPLPYERRRLWVGPEADAFLWRSIPIGGSSKGCGIVFEASLLSTALADVLLSTGDTPVLSWSVAAEVSACLRGSRVHGVPCI